MSLPSEEQWRPVPGYEGLYEVSDRGRVLSHQSRRPKILRMTPNDCGYLIVSLRKDKRQRSVRVHRLVAGAFCDRREGTYEIRHMNGIRTDNRVSNLLWGTRVENVFDTVDHGNHRNARKTHCLRGHEFTPENTNVRRDGKTRDGREWRDCRACKRLRNRKAAS